MTNPTGALEIRTSCVASPQSSQIRRSDSSKWMNTEAPGVECHDCKCEIDHSRSRSRRYSVGDDPSFSSTVGVCDDAGAPPGAVRGGSTAPPTTGCPVLAVTGGELADAIVATGAERKAPTSRPLSVRRTSLLSL